MHTQYSYSTYVSGGCTLHGRLVACVAMETTVVTVATAEVDGALVLAVVMTTNTSGCLTSSISSHTSATGKNKEGERRERGAGSRREEGVGEGRKREGRREKGGKGRGEEEEGGKEGEGRKRRGEEGWEESRREEGVG